MSKRAILIGINGYPEGSGLAPLRYAEDDAQDLAQALERGCGFQCTVLLGASATRDAIEQAVEFRAPAEVLLFFFAGHGRMVRGLYNLHPVDSLADGRRAMSFESFYRAWQAEGFGAAKVLAVLDACRSEPSGQRGARGFTAAESRDIVAATQGRRWVEVLYGCGEGQVSYEDEGLRHGVLTHALLEVLRSHYGYLDTDILAGATADRMEEWSRSDPCGRWQIAQRYYVPSLRRKLTLLGEADASEARPSLAREAAIAPLQTEVATPAREQVVGTAARQAESPWRAKFWKVASVLGFALVLSLVAGMLISEVRRPPAERRRQDQALPPEEPQTKDREKEELRNEDELAKTMLPPALQEVVKLARAGLNQDVIVAKIKNDGVSYDLTIEQVRYLSSAGISQEVIAALRQSKAGEQVRDQHRPGEEQQEKARQIGELRTEGELAAVGLKPGDARVIELGNAVHLELCAIPAGEFLMRSTQAEREWAMGPGGAGQTVLGPLDPPPVPQLPPISARQGKEDWFANEGEAPQLTRITNAFWMGQPEVTVGQWKRFVAETSYETDAEKGGEARCFDWDKRAWGLVKGRSWRDPNYGFGVRNEHPVACVSWNDAVAFCRWLTARERAAARLAAGLEVRLPLEAEWEYACRGRQAGTRFWWGDSEAEGHGRLNAASNDKLGHSLPNTTWRTTCGWSDGYAWVSPVDAFGANGRNGFGLADMLGNVGEWCQDGYDEKGAREDAGTGDTARRVVRGGSFRSPPAAVRCASRAGENPSYASASLGFRVLMGVVR
jgi:formylglycine-generating enzyme required for sulfatase activity